MDPATQKRWDSWARRIAREEARAALLASAPATAEVLKAALARLAARIDKLESQLADRECGR